MPKPDEAGLAARGGGAHAAVERVLLEFRPLVLRCARLAACYLPSEAWGELVAEAEFHLVCLVNDFDPERGVPLAAYLQLMLPQRTRNYIRGELRRRARECPMPDCLVEPGGGEGLHDATWGYRDVLVRVWLQQALAVLSPREREVVRCLCHGESIREIAASMGLSVSSAQRCKQRALAKLREQW